MSMATSRKEHLATVLMHSSESTSDAMAVHSSFPTTQWTTLLDPIKGRGQGFDCALNQLCRFYRPPIVAFIRGWGYDPNTAEDLAHDFIARLLRLDELTKVDRTKGRFRSFVCASLRHFLHNYNKAKHAWKRGGRAEHISLEGLAVDPPSPTNAETEFNHCWAQSVADEGLRRLSAEWADRGKSIEFADYQDFIFAKKIYYSMPSHRS